MKKNLAGDGPEPTLKKNAGVNVPDKRRLLTQYSYFMLTLRDYFCQIVPLDRAVLTQEMKDLLKLSDLVSKIHQVDAR